MTLNFRVKSHIFNILAESKTVFFHSSDDHQKNDFLFDFFEFLFFSSFKFFLCLSLSFFWIFVFRFFVLLSNFRRSFEFFFRCLFWSVDLRKIIYFFFDFSCSLFLFFFCFFQFLDNCLNLLFVSVLILSIFKGFIIFFSFFFFVLSFKMIRIFRLIEISYDVIKNLNIQNNIEIVEKNSKMIWFILKMISIF